MFGIINPFFVFSFITLTFLFVFIQTLGSLIMEELSFRKFTSLKTIFVLFAYSFFESFGYRQRTLIWRAKGFISFFKRYKKIQEDSNKLNEKINQIVNKGKIQW